MRAHRTVTSRRARPSRPGARSRHGWLASRRGLAITSFLVVFGGLSALAALSPREEADAALPIPIPLPNIPGLPNLIPGGPDIPGVPELPGLVGGPPGLAGGLFGGGIGGIAIDAIEAIVKWLFGSGQTSLTQDIIGWLTHLDNWSGSTSSVTALMDTTTLMAWGLLGAVLSIALLRFWLVAIGPGGSNTYDVFEGLARTVLACILLLLWPYLFDNAIALSNIAADTLLGSESVTTNLQGLFNAALIGGFAAGSLSGGLGAIVGIILAFVGTILFLALALMKIVLTASLVVLKVGMPLAIIFWPIPETAWISRFAAKTFIAILFVPLVWTLIFAAFGAVGMDAFKLGETDGGVLTDAIIQPLTGIALLYLALTVPKQLLNVATMGARTPGGGFVARTASYMAGRAAWDAVGGAVGGPRAAPAAPGAGPGAGPGSQGQPGFLAPPRTAATGAGAGGSGFAGGSANGGSSAHAAMRGAAVLAPGAGGAAAQVGARAVAGQLGAGAAPKLLGAGGTAAAGTAEKAGHSATDASAERQGTPGAAAMPDGGGLRETPAWSAGYGQLVKHEKRMAAATAANDPPGPEAVGEALGELAPRAQQQVGELASQPNFRAQMAMHAANGAYTAAERGAFRTLAASDPQVVSQAIASGAPSAAGGATSAAASAVSGPSGQSPSGAGATHTGPAANGVTAATVPAADAGGPSALSDPGTPPNPPSASPPAPGTSTGLPSSADPAAPKPPTPPARPAPPSRGPGEVRPPFSR